MRATVNFLCEIGTEEIPAGYLPPALETLKKMFIDSLEENRISHDGIDVYATPRRIVVAVSSLAGSQRGETVELKGPAARAAYDAEGRPTKALEGFLKGNNVLLDDTFKASTDKGEYIFARKKMDARPTAEIIPMILEKMVRDLPFPKKMHWSDKKLTFPRPIRYFLILFNNSVIPFEIEGVRSDNRTRGHFVQHNRMIEINDIARYQELLGENGVILDQNERKELIRRELLAAAEKIGGVLVEDEDLLNIVTFLVENPNIATCQFDRAFLDIPDVVLIAEMKEHQKYFAVRDKNGNLMNHFLVTSNNPVTENVVAGNVRVITARFNDARFFYDEDRGVKLIDRVESLKKVMFHKDLGSIYDKVVRVGVIADELAKALKYNDSAAEKVKRAVLLSKADLDTAMVFEFTSLQGQIGRIYALHDGEDPEVAAAIDDHYRPRFQGDRVPDSPVSIVLSLAEKIDNLMGSFSVGNIPRGSQDPYALRRQANAVVEILLRNEINLDLKKILVAVASGYRDGANLVPKIIEFTGGRAKTLFTDRGMRYDEIDACLAVDSTDYLELFRRAKAVNEFRKDPRFSEMLMGFKRMNNIVSAFRKQNADYTLSFNPSLMSMTEEKELFSFFDSRKDVIREYITSSRYVDLFSLIIDGKGAIDSFFDTVLVMDKNTSVRDNRLYILESILSNFTSILDFSRIMDV